MAQSSAGLKRAARAAIALGAFIISLYNAVMSLARPKRYRVLTAFASLALLLRIAIPVGFMPSGITGGWYLELCPDGMPEHVMVALYGEHHAHHGAGSDNLFFECDYGNGATGAFALDCQHTDPGHCAAGQPIFIVRFDTTAHCAFVRVPGTRTSLRFSLSSQSDITYTQRSYFMRHRFTACAVMLVACATANAGLRPDNHAPITVMGDHIHEKGELMFSYRYMHMSMKDNPRQHIPDVTRRNRHYGTQSFRQSTDDAADTAGCANQDDDGHAHVGHHVRTHRPPHPHGYGELSEEGHDTHYVRRAHGHRAFGQIQDQHKRYRRHLGRRPLRPVSR